MKKPPSRVSPEELFTQAVAEEGDQLSSGDMRLLISGLAAMRAAQGRPLNKLELMSVKSMIAYVAYMQNVDEERVALVLTTRYGVETVENLPSIQFTNIIEYLVDLEMDKILN